MRSSKGKYISTVRDKHKYGNLSKKHAELMAFDFPEWITQRYRSWADRYAECLEAYKSQGKLISGTPEATWIVRQRASYLSGNLSEDRYKELTEGIPDWLDLNSDSWTRSLLQDMQKFSVKGKVLSPKDSDWLNYQRGLLKQGRLSANHKQKLDKNLPGWSEVEYVDTQPTQEEIKSSHERSMQNLREIAAVWSSID